MRPNILIFFPSVVKDLLGFHPEECCKTCFYQGEYRIIRNSVFKYFQNFHSVFFRGVLQVLHVPKLSRSDFESWLCTNPLQRLESLVIFKAPELTLDTIMWLLEELEAITELGDLHSMDFAKASGEVR